MTVLIDSGCGDRRKFESTIMTLFGPLHDTSGPGESRLGVYEQYDSTAHYSTVIG